LLGTFFIPQG